MKKAQTQFGVAIIAMAILLLLGGVFFDDNSNTKSIYLKNKEGNSNNGYYVNGIQEENYLFYLNETELGRQRKVVESFPNVELGSKEEFNTVYIGNSFTLNANPFDSNEYKFNVQLSDPENVEYLLLYFNPDRIKGTKELIVKRNGIIVSKNLARGSDIPIRIPLDGQEKPYNVEVSFQLDKPAWYQLLNWNKMEVDDLKVVELIQDRSNRVKTFNFDIDKTFLEDTIIDLSISCDQIGDVGKSIKVKVNGYIVSDTNPNCASRFNRISTNISEGILNQGRNELQLETQGYYKIAYSINKVYFNDQEVYKFNINSFNDIIDVVMYGDFDKEIIDLRLNGKTMTLKRDDVKSIIQYLKFGTNEIKFITKPLEIKEFVIEKNEFIG